MGRHVNPDYYKVAGRVESRDVSAASRALVSARAAELRRATSKSAQRKAKSLRSETDETASAPPKRRRAPAAVVHRVQRASPRHGKKRRATQKRHETNVMRELRAHPEESPARAAAVVRALPRPGPRRTPITMPATPERGALRYMRNLMDMWRGLVSFATELAAAPVTLVRLIGALRRSR